MWCNVVWGVCRLGRNRQRGLLVVSTSPPQNVTQYSAEMRCRSFPFPPPPWQRNVADLLYFDFGAAVHSLFSAVVGFLLAFVVVCFPVVVVVVVVAV